MLAGRAPATGDGDGKPDGGGDSGDTDLRPGAPEWRQAVDDHYTSLADALETMDPETRARFEDDYARTTGVLPGPVLKRLRGGLLSADPAEQAFAATRLARLKEGNPGLVSVIPADERARAGAIAEFADLGLQPARAVELAEEKLAGGRRTEGAGEGGGEDQSTLVGPGGEGTGEDAPLASDTKGEEDQSPPQQVNTAGTNPQKASTGKNKESLDKVERTYRGYVEIGRKMGLDFAADNLERFLDGTSGTKIITRDEARQFDAIKEAEDTNRTRFEESFLQAGNIFKPQHKFNAALNGIKDGQTIDLGTDHWKRDFEFTDNLIQAVTGELDFVLGIGRTGLKSKGAFTATRKVNVIHIKGVVDNAWKDTYNFHPNQSFADGALALQKHRGARPFFIRAGWKQKIQGTIEIVNGELTNPQFQWQDANSP